MKIADKILEGDKLRLLREKSELSQGQLAYLIGVRQPAISKYESGGVRNLWVIQRIASALKVEMEELI